MTASVSTDLEVAEFAGQLFFRLWRASHTRTAEELDSIGLTPALFALLNVLGAREGSIQPQLSSDMGIDPSAMVKLINELEDAGLAKRRRRPGDRRAWEVSITPKGRRTLEGARDLSAGGGRGAGRPHRRRSPSAAHASPKSARLGAGATALAPRGGGALDLADPVGDGLRRVAVPLRPDGEPDQLVRVTIEARLATCEPRYSTTALATDTAGFSAS